MFRDHRRLTTCRKQHRQNEVAGWVDVPTGVEVRVTGDPGHIFKAAQARRAYFFNTSGQKATEFVRHITTAYGMKDEKHLQLK